MRWRGDEEEEEEQEEEEAEAAAEVSREVAIETEPLGRGEGGSRRDREPALRQRRSRRSAFSPAQVKAGWGGRWRPSPSPGRRGRLSGGRSDSAPAVGEGVGSRDPRLGVGSGVGGGESGDPRRA